MDEILKEILKLNKLIKVLIQQEDIDALQSTLKEKNELINKYNKLDGKNMNKKIFEDIQKLDEENIKNMKKLMNKTQAVIQDIKKEKGEVKKKSQKLRKYNVPNSSSGYRFDRKK